MVEATQDSAPTNTASQESEEAKVVPSTPDSAQAAAEQEEEKKGEPASGLPTISRGATPLPKTLRGQFEYGKSLKEEGNLYFKQRDYANAVKKYARVRAFLRPMIPSSDAQGQDNSQFLNMISQQSQNDEDKLSKEEVKEAIQVKASTFLNLAICYFLTGEFRKSIARATESLDLQKSVKAYYRRAQALAKINDFWGATADLKEAIKMDPADPNNFANELAKFESAAIAKDKKSDRKLNGFLLK